MSSRLKPLARDLAAQCLLTAGLTRPSHCARDKLVVVTFHRVLPREQIDEYVMPGLAVTPEELRWFLEFFSRHLECGTLAEMCSRTRPSEKPRLAITFDDGQLDNFIHAKPVLDRLGLKASFFVVYQATEERQPLWPDRLGHSAWAAAREAPHAAGPLYTELGVDFRPTREAAVELIDSAKLLPPAQRADLLQRVFQAAGGDRTPTWDGFMSWGQLRRLVDEGHEVGSHSLTHEILPLCSDPSLEDEVSGSRSLIEERLQSELISFCYPNGNTDERVADAVRDAGYRQAVTTSWGLNPRDRDPFLLKRCDMTSSHATDRHGRMSEARVAWRMSGLHPGLSA